MSEHANVHDNDDDVTPTHQTKKKEILILFK